MTPTTTTPSELGAAYGSRPPTPHSPLKHDYGKMNSDNTQDSNTYGVAAGDLFARALGVVRDRTFVSCTTLGESLWGSCRTCKGRQSYARPAGKLIKRLLLAGLITPARQAQLGYAPQVKDPPLYCLSDQPMHPRYSRANDPGQARAAKLSDLQKRIHF